MKKRTVSPFSDTFKEVSWAVNAKSTQYCVGHAHRFKLRENHFFNIHITVGIQSLALPLRLALSLPERLTILPDRAKGKDGVRILHL